ncbi:hypothetical protein LINPERHAP2_LOCUS32845, partial [Linum perenne]
MILKQVRLMGGEIVIVDKEEGQKGTCIRFGALLTDTNHNNKTNIELGNKITGCAGPFHELHKAVTNFKTGLQFSSIKVVWLDKPFSRRFEDGMVDPSDDVMLKPFHGAGLNEVIQLIPDFQRTTTPVEELASSSSSIHLNARDNEIQEEEEDWMRPNKPLNGLTFLVVVNHKYIWDISTFVLTILEAKFEECED